MRIGLKREVTVNPRFSKPALADNLRRQKWRQDLCD